MSKHQGREGYRIELIGGPAAGLQNFLTPMGDDGDELLPDPPNTLRPLGGGGLYRRVGTTLTYEWSVEQ